MIPLAFLRQPVIEKLGWALLHFLWEGALIALLFGVANAALRRAGANARYLLACGALALMVASVGATFWRLESTGAAPALLAAPAPVATVPEAAVAPVLRVPAARFEAEVAAFLPWVVFAWLAGVMALSIRCVGGWLIARRLAFRNAVPAEAAWARSARELGRRLGVARPVRVLQSLAAEAPAVVGWLRPAILVPAGAFLGLDARQLEALLAHELAHIRRHDYLINLLETAVETLLFYHPAVWWISRRIRVERENCCDDLAIAACGDVLTYARALTRLEELRAPEPRFALAASGGSLLVRIQRLIGAGQPARHNGKSWVAGVLAGCIAIAVWAGAQIAWAGNRAAASVAAASVTPAAPAPQPAPAQSQRPTPAPKPARESAPAPSGGFIAGLAAAGYPNLSVDELIAFKIHQVTPEYIRQLAAAGMTNLKPDQLVAFRIHGVDPKQLEAWRAAGFKLTPDNAVAMRIHSVTPEFANEMKAVGFKNLDVERLVAFRIHGVNAAAVREIESLGLGTPTPDDAVALRIHGVTPDFVRGLKDAGITRLSYEDVIAARIHGITRAFIEEAAKHGFRNQTLQQLIRLKLSGVLSSDTI